jgi:hypothetical protein
MRPKGWTPQRRAQQAAMIRRWQPWRHSTGPRTELGKARCAMNPRPHANRAYALAVYRARQMLRLAARNLAILRALKPAASFRAKPEGRSRKPLSRTKDCAIYSPFATPYSPKHRRKE